MGFSRSSLGTAAYVALLAVGLCACKLGKSEDDPESRPLPVVDSSAPTAEPPKPAEAPPAPKAAAPPTPAATDAVKDEAQAPATVSTPKAATTQAAGTSTTAGAAKSTTAGADKSTTAGADKSTTAGAAKGTTTGSASPSVKAPSAACLSKCVAAFQQCLAGAKLGDDIAVKCQGALKSCQADCS